MTDADLQALIDAAEAYERVMVPALMRAWTGRMADAAGIHPGDRVLDVACGTGVLTREAASRVGSHGAVTGVDANAGMIAVARRHAPAITFRQGLAEQLPFPDCSFDAVVSQFGVMFFRDRQAALSEMLRVLVPGGRIGIAVWDSVENIPAYAAEIALLERRGGAAAANALRAPFVLGNRDELAALCRESRMAGVAVATGDASARFPSVRVMVEADLRGWLPVMGVVLSEARIGEILAEADAVLAPFVDAGGAIVFDQSAHIVSGVKPS